MLAAFILKADAHRADGKRLVVHADEKLTAFLELESATRLAELRHRDVLSERLDFLARML